MSDKGLKTSDKALLVMNMPGSCMGCNFFFCDGDTNMDSCMARETARSVDLEKYDKPDWCPLKPIPEKKPVVLDALDSFGNGWNDCINKILEGCKNG